MEVTAKDKLIESGYQAFYQGEHWTDNPYDKHLAEPQHKLWEDGWYQGYDEDALYDDSEDSIFEVVFTDELKCKYERSDD